MQSTKAAQNLMVGPETHRKFLTLVQHSGDVNKQIHAFDGVSGIELFWVLGRPPVRHATRCKLYSAE